MNSAEFTGTVIANFPDNGNDESRRILSYMNTAQSVETSDRLLPINTGPNAMIFPIYGEVIEVVACPDPEASRKWLSKQRGVYKEDWEDDFHSMRRGGSYEGDKIKTAGNYLVSVASGVEDIPTILHRLRTNSPHPEYVPEVGDDLLAMINQHYHRQALGIPQFPIAVFALHADQVEQKNPITLRYNQSPELAQAIFPALDYHGSGQLQPYVKRDHRLLLATKELNELFCTVMRNDDTDRPPEFAQAPAQFPVEVRDQRPGNGNLSPTTAPNNDYMFDSPKIHAALQTVRAELASLTSPWPEEDFSTHYAKKTQIGKLVTDALGEFGLMGHANQPAIDVEAFLSNDGVIDTSNVD